jgi:predicted negative regulator of RcsB-dependent stress response
VAKYNKKRARELQHDKFRDTAGKVFDKAADQLEGRGKVIVYGLVGVVLVAVLVGVYMKWSNRKADEARRALGRGITIAIAPVASSEPQAEGAPAPAYATSQERAEKAIEVFQLVAAKYGDPYKTEAQYLIATNLLGIDREKAMAQLAEIAKSNVTESATLAKFALAQAKEGDGKLDEAAKLYSELAGQNSPVVTPDTANLRLAGVYEKQGKKKEATDLLFNMVEASRKAKDSDGTSLPPNSASRDAGEKLQKLDADRYAKLTPEAPSGNSPF